jgi:hypothetical protein
VPICDITSASMPLGASMPRSYPAAAAREPGRHSDARSPGHVADRAATQYTVNGTVSVVTSSARLSLIW